MEEQQTPGQIVVLNGAPRAGKSSIVRSLASSVDLKTSFTMT